MGRQCVLQLTMLPLHIVHGFPCTIYRNKGCKLQECQLDDESLPAVLSSRTHPADL